MMMDEVFTGRESSTSPFRSIRSFMMLIMKNCEVKYSGKMKTNTRMIESNGSGGETGPGSQKCPSRIVAGRESVYLETCVFCEDDVTSSCLSSSFVIPSVGEGVGTFSTGPSGTADPYRMVPATNWPFFRGW